MEKYLEYEKNNNMIFKLHKELNNSLRNTINNEDWVNKYVYSNIDDFAGLNRIQFLIEIQVYDKSHIPYNYLTF